ncbi:hypothetical protein L3Q82_000781 [Scortum barcoo]|uniref:Uncharacterized protein n=1 Tax=Scortum barcoo TaxID=214431 RepID=A0ACB8WCM8_9TELE|nr:hypothetical protein L3Q82_000781 [Scortum barcoo]
MGDPTRPSMDAKEIVHCALQIEKSSADRSFGDILTLLGDLDQAHVTAEQLETTDIVRVLYKLLKTCPEEGVKRVAKSLLSKWKRQYSKDGRGVKCTEERREVSCRGVEAGEASQTSDSKVESVKCAEKEEVEEAASLGVKDGLPTLPRPAESPSTSCDISPVRSKCVQLLLAALRTNIPDDKEAAELARGIEQHIHERHKSSQPKYKACVRSKVANLRNPQNGHLWRGLQGGSLSPETFAGMSVEEMASAELRQLREEYSCRGVSERQLPRGIEGTQTQKIRCKRCGGSDCRVTQVSRGALFLPAWVKQSGPDEDAMTFVTCSGCGQQWYHSGWRDSIIKGESPERMTGGGVTLAGHVSVICGSGGQRAAGTPERHDTGGQRLFTGMGEGSLTAEDGLGQVQELRLLAE